MSIFFTSYTDQSFFLNTIWGSDCTSSESVAGVYLIGWDSSRDDGTLGMLMRLLVRLASRVANLRFSLPPFEDRYEVQAPV